jgi:hypothetical protein
LAQSKVQADREFAMGYIVGVADAASAEHLYCIPLDGAAAGQVRDVVLNYLAEKPEARHYQAAPLVRTALATAWPCPHTYAAYFSCDDRAPR